MVLDASVLIAHLDGGDRHHRAATELLSSAVDEPLGASPVTLAEVLVGPARAGLLERALSALRELAVRTVPLPDDAPQALARLRVGTNLKLPDCCVLLAAHTEAAAVATFDEKLAEAARGGGLGVAGPAPGSE